MPVIENGEVRLVEVSEDVLQVVATTTRAELVTVGIQGPPGPPGPTSPGTTYIHEQGTPSTTWTINHNLGQYPSVTVVDSAKSLIIGEYQYLSPNALVVQLTVATGGFAYLN